jgi:hypothetical protein
MLASITPLGERGRSSKWPVTVAFFIAGSVLSAAALGALAGALGGLTWPRGFGAGHLRFATLALALAAGVVIDLGVGGLRVPSIRRQVNEDWLLEYRGWVYGLGFGVQLGVGVSTIVTTTAVYGTIVAAWITGDPVLGAVVAGSFGLVRGASLLAGARVTSTARLVALHTWIGAWRGRVRTIGVAAQAALVAVALAGVVG